MNKTQDLVLQPRQLKNEAILEKYRGVLDVICGDGDDEQNPYHFQKIAVEMVLRYMTQYKNLAELISEQASDEYKKYYQGKESKDKEKKIGTIDLPTGTGKSFVMFAAAIILYNEIKEIKRIQVIVPSTTIRKQLTEKFTSFIDKLARMQDIKLPSLTSLHENELLEGNLAIDNIHRFYETENAQISKEHSFGNKRGGDVLIINDEAHHIYNAKESISGGGEKDLRKWLDFLRDGHYAFKYILNFTATPFEAQKTYLNNVIYRYSLEDAINNNVVKDVKYLPQGDGHLELWEDIEKQQLELAIDELEAKQKQFKKVDSVRPFGIVVCADIKTADEVVDKMKKDLGVGEKNVIAYTTKHLQNEELVVNIDSEDSEIDWVVSVGMLTEGWDAKNVFVIVPHHKRAFDSKLLISQMVGRGLRRVDEIPGDLNEVLILNHRAWGEKEIEMLINDVVDVSPKIEFGMTNDFHFDIYKVVKGYKECNTTLPGTAQQIKLESVLKEALKDFIEQKESSDASILTNTIKGVTGELNITKNYTDRYIQRNHVVIWYNANILGRVDIKTPFANGDKFIDYVLGSKTIKQSQVKDKLHPQNLEIIKNCISDAFNSDDVGDENVYEYKLKKINTKDMQGEKVRVDTFLQNGERLKVLYSPATYNLETSKMYGKLLSQEQLRLEKKLGVNHKLINKENIKISLSNIFDKVEEKEKYKTPLEVVRYDSNNEKLFVERLLNSIEKIKSWVKSRSVGFYTVDIDDDKKFNPDFILRLKSGETLLVEIKDDNDISLLNALKLKGIQERTKILNEKIKKQYKGKIKPYYAFIIRPIDYNEFIGEVLNNGNYKHIPKYHRELQKKTYEIQKSG